MTDLTDRQWHGESTRGLIVHRMESRGNEKCRTGPAPFWTSILSQSIWD